MAKKSGFPDERISVIPRPRLQEASQRAVLSRLLVTDCGYFPRAREHERRRTNGSAEWILIFCTDGFGHGELDGIEFRVCPGQVLVIPKHESHIYGADEDEPWTVWWMHLDGTDVKEILEEAGASLRSPVLPVPDLPRAVALVEEALRAMEHDDSDNALQIAAAAAWHVVALLGTSTLARNVHSIDPVRKAVALLQQDSVKKWSVRELAREAHLSVSHFSALFRQDVGCGPHEYQTRLRMMRSRQLLDTTDMSIAAIARAVGYSDPMYFSRQFKSIHGISATQHRARAKG